MILSCPSCSKKFMLDAALLGTGRKVRCGSCATIWYQEPPPGTVPPAANRFPDDTQTRSRIRFDPEEETGPDWAAPESKPNTTAANLPALAGERTGGGRRLKAALPWAALIVAVGALGGLLVEGRDRIVAAWPAANGLYEMVGMPVERLGVDLAMEVQTEFREIEGNPMLFVEGKVTNGSDRMREVPDIRAVAIGEQGEELHAWRIVPSARRLFGGQATSFKSSVPETGAPAKSVSFVFVEPEPRQP